jgi:hypothetical protein
LNLDSLEEDTHVSRLFALIAVPTAAVVGLAAPAAAEKWTMASGYPDGNYHTQNVKRLLRLVDINGLRALAPLPCTPVTRPSRPQPRTPPPRWSPQAQEATRRFRSRHVIRDGRRLPAAHSDSL